MKKKFFYALLSLILLLVMLSCAHTEVLGKNDAILPANTRKADADKNESEVTITWEYKAKTTPIYYNAQRLFVYHDGDIVATVKTGTTEKIVVNDGNHNFRFVPARKKSFFWIPVTEKWIPAGEKKDNPVIEATVASSKDDTIIDVDWAIQKNTSYQNILYFSQIRKAALPNQPLKIANIPRQNESKANVPQAINTAGTNTLQRSVGDELNLLIDMYNKGLLSENEFNMAKARLLQ